ncbi:MAG: polysaccharide biosynthesis C-terminal domain-containing protein [Stigonema ocellatum SAG 48.90 = DSM 106950]|nr:polysaccharide biosynthesis C-terminal domain-containing protein [Stigonema ocellatum SAG 48.90 = DSM 106950]
MNNLQLRRLINVWHSLTNGSVNRKIFGAAVIIGLLTVVVKVVAFIKELLVAWKFGTGDAVDAFLIALMVPAFVMNVLGSSLSVALIPTYIHIEEKEGKKAAQSLLYGVIICGIGLLAITTILIVVTAPIYLPWIAAGFDRRKLDLTFHLLCAIAPVIFLQGIVVLWGAVLNAGERFAIAALSPITTPVISVVLLLTVESWGIFNLAMGLVFGSLLEMVLLGVALKRQGISLLPKWSGFNTHLRQVASQYVPTVAGACLLCSAGVVDQTMAAMLPPGSVAALNYGNRVISSPLSLMSTALGVAVVPYFSKMVACEDWSGLRTTLTRYLRLIFLLLIPMTILFIVFSEPIVAALFKRGSFTDENTKLVAQIQAYNALQIPFYLANLLLIRLISSMRINHLIMQAAAFNSIINIGLNYICILWMGVKGIALSTSCVYVFSSLYLLFLTRKHLNKFE